MEASGPQHVGMKQENRFTKYPIQMEMVLFLVRIDNVPMNARRGTSSSTVFVDGINPGLMLGVKESRARRSILLAFASETEQTHAVTYLHELQAKKTAKVLCSFPGDMDFSTCRVSAFGSGRVMCTPVCQAYGGEFFDDSIAPLSAPMSVTVHVWAVEVDVFRHATACDVSQLETMFKKVTNMAAVVRIMPATTGAGSSKCRVYVADKTSAVFLKENAKQLGFYKVLSEEECDIRHPLVRGVEDSLVLHFLAMGEGPTLPLSPLIPIITKRTRSIRLVVQLLHQDDWLVGLTMDGTSFGPMPLFPRGHIHRFPKFRKIVSFPDRDVGYFAQYMQRDEVKRILNDNRCVQVPKHSEHIAHFASSHRTIVLEARTEADFVRAREELHELARRIVKRLVYRRILLEIPDIAVAVRTVVEKLTIHGPRTVRYRKPKMIPVLNQLCLCRASITPVQGSAAVMRLAVVQAAKRILQAKVDMLVVFSDSQLLLLGGLSKFASDYGGSQVHDECDAWVSLNGPIRGNTVPVLSSGTLNSPAIAYCSLNRRGYPTLYDTVKNALQSLFETANQVHAKSIALPFPISRFNQDVLTGKEWLTLVSEQAGRSLQAGCSLEEVVVSSSLDTSEKPNEDLKAALASLMQEESDHVVRQDGYLMFKITWDEPDEKQLLFDLPQASLLLVAESQQDLETGEVALRQALDNTIETSNISCNGLNSSSVVAAWRNWQMDYKTYCTLKMDGKEQGQLVLRGSVKDAMAARDHLIDFIKQLADGTMSLSPVEPHTSAVSNVNEVVEITDADSTAEPPLSYDNLTDVISTKQARLRRVKIFLCGEYGTGKSSLIRALLGEEFIHNADSTEGVSITRTMASALPGMSTSMSNTAGHVFRRFAGVKELFADVAAGVARQEHGIICPSEMCGIPEHQLDSTTGREGDLLGVPMTSAAIATRSYSPSDSVSTEYDLDDAVGSPDEDIDNLASPDITSQLSTTGLDAPWTPEVLIGVDDDVMAKIQEIASLPDDKLMERMCVEFWDCGGQLAMSSQQSICMDTTRAVFVLTFDASKSLSNLVKEEVFRHGGKHITIPVLYQGMTHRDFLLMWLSIAALRHERTSADQEHAKVEKSDKTKVFIVATHIDMVKEPDAMMEELRNDVDSIQLSTDCQHLEMLGPYFVDNRRPCDTVVAYSEVVVLRQQLVESVESFEVDEIPLNRMKLELAMCELQSSAMALPSQQQSGKDGKRVSRMHITFSEFEELARYVTNDSMSSDEVMATLRYYHELGAVICNEHKQPNKDSTVFLCAEWILHKFVELIIVPLKNFRLQQNRRNQLHNLELLKKSGILPSSLLETLWEDVEAPVQDSLMQIMCHFDLASELHEPATRLACSFSNKPTQHQEQRKRYFVPLCISRHQAKNAALPSGMPCILPTLVLKFTGSFFPPMVFSRVALHCVRLLRASNPLIDLNVVKFTVQTAHHVRISWFRLGMFIAVHSSSRSKVAEFSHRLLRVIQESLQQLRQKGFKGLQWHQAFHCQTCFPGYEDGEAETGGGSNASSSASRQLHPILRPEVGLISLENIQDIIQMSASESADVQMSCDHCGEHSHLPPDYVHYWIARRSDSARSVGNGGAGSCPTPLQSSSESRPSPAGSAPGAGQRSTSTASSGRSGAGCGAAVNHHTSLHSAELPGEQFGEAVHRASASQSGAAAQSREYGGSALAGAVLASQLAAEDLASHDQISATFQSGNDESRGNHVNISGSNVTYNIYSCKAGMNEACAPTVPVQAATDYTQQGVGQPGALQPADAELTARQLTALCESAPIQEHYELFIQYLPHLGPSDQESGSRFSMAEIRELKKEHPTDSKQPFNCLMSALHQWSSESCGVSMLIAILKDENSLPESVKEAALRILAS